MGNSSSSSSSGGTAAPAQRRPSYYSMLKNSYQALVHAIIRPPRSLYDVSKLGPSQFQFCGRTFKRTDFTLVNPREQRLCCSLWEPIESDRPSATLPCVIYMHGNSSSRLESLAALSLVLGMGAMLLSFDFAGSGRSDGEYVSLGVFEKDDLQCVIEYLRASQTTSTIALWGRSMGAATALLHGERDPSIAAMVLDSAFSSLVTLAEEMVEMGRKQGLFAPGFVVRMAIQFVRSSVQKTAGFDIYALVPIESADKCFIPALFIAAEDDNFVNKSHSEAIHARYGGDKNLVLVEGDHNSPRPRFLYDSIGIFLTQTLQLPASWALEDAHLYIRRLPWTYQPPPGPNTYASLSAVGSKHAQGQGSSGSSSRGGGAAGAAGGTWATVGGEGGGSEGGDGAQKLSFDELLALSIALNEEEDGAEYDALQGQPGVSLEHFQQSQAAYGADYEFDDADLADADAAEAADDRTAERAMQAGVQQSLFQFMSATSGTSGSKSDAPPPPPPPLSSSSGAGPSAVLPPRPGPDSTGSNGVRMFVNPITKREHAVGDAEGRGSPSIVGADAAIGGTVCAGGSGGSVTWRCVVCSGNNMSSVVVCMICRAKR